MTINIKPESCNLGMTNEIEVFNRKLLKQRRNRAAERFAEHDFIVNHASENTIERIIERGSNNYKLALDLSCHIGLLGKKLLQQNICKQVVFADLSKAMLDKIEGPRIVADEEYLPFANASFDLIVSSMGMHLINDLPGALIQIRKCLQPKGFFIATLPGPETLRELRHALMEAEIEITGGVAPHIAPFADVKTLGHLLQRAGFAQVVADSETIEISYSDIKSLFADLRKMGEGNALSKRNHYLRKDVLKETTAKYHDLFNNNEGGILATVEIITITGLAV